MTISILSFLHHHLLLLLLNAASASPTVAKNTTTFIITSCKTYTSYPTLCVSSLSPYAASVNNNPLHLAQCATTLSLSTLNSAASESSSLYSKNLKCRPTKNTTNTLKALKDCVELLQDAADNTRYSRSELKKLDAAGGREAMWRLANAQTYMSAALTKGDTCTDGLEEMGAVVKPVSGRVVRAKKYTSNALGLVNSLRYGYSLRVE